MEVHNNNNINVNNKSSKLLPTPPKLDFKSDLEAKILKQKEKLKKQEDIVKQLQQKQQLSSNSILQSCSNTTPTWQQLQKQQPKQQLNHNINNSINCNSSSITNKTKALETSLSSTSTQSPASSLSSSSLTSHSNNINNYCSNIHTSSLSSSFITSNNHDLLKPTLNSHHPNSHIHAKTPLPAHPYKASSPPQTTSSSSPSQPALNSVSPSASFNVVTPPIPPPLPPTNTINCNNIGSMLCNTSPAPLLANVAKPSITPRPASLSGLCLLFLFKFYVFLFNLCLPFG